MSDTITTATLDARIDALTAVVIKGSGPKASAQHAEKARRISEWKALRDALNA